MASIPLTDNNIASVKEALRTFKPNVRSSHLTEALAVSLRRRTHASLLAELPIVSSDPPIEFLDESLFDQRLQELGYPSDPRFSFEGLGSKIICTRDHSAVKIKYKSLRQKAWRNLMVYTINVAIQRKLFSLRPDDNRWPTNKNDYLFDFELPNGLPVRGYVHDIGWGELSIRSAVNPKGDVVRFFNAGFDAGDAHAGSWLERKKGAWLQSSFDFKCKKPILSLLVDLNVAPMGFGDRGRVIM